MSQSQNQESGILFVDTQTSEPGWVLRTAECDYDLDLDSDTPVAVAVAEAVRVAKIDAADIVVV